MSNRQQASDSMEEVMFAFQHFAGLDEATAARMCQNPELVRKMRRELDEARDRSGTPTVPTDTLTASLDEAMKKFEEEKGKSIQRNPPLTPRYMLLEAARQARAQLLAPRGPNQVRTLQSFTGIPKSFSSTPLSQLRFIAFKDLSLRKVHKGRYLLARIISQPYRQVGVSCIIEDPAGDAFMLSIYNAIAVGSCYVGNELDLLYPIGSILAIREPNLKVPMMGGNGIIRVETPSDVHFLSNSDPLVANVRWNRPAPVSPFSKNCDFKVEGNKYFVKQEYRVAESLYSRGLREQLSADQRLLLYLNRSAAHLQLSNYASARRDVACVLQLIEESDRPDSETNMKLKEKALFRLANSQYGQRKFPLAKSTFITLLQTFPTSQQAKDGIAKCEAREKEAATGEFDFVGMYKAGKKGGAVRLDVADYQGPMKVEEIATRGGGRGIVATRQIKAGEVMLVERAFDVSFVQDLDEKCLVTSIDILRRDVKFNTGISHVAGIVSKLIDDPSLIPIIDSLYAGPTATAPVPLSAIPPEEPPADGVGIDVARIELVCTVNDFNTESTDLTPTSRSSESVPETALRTIGSPTSPSALYVTASFFNHSCDSNVLWRGFGDTIVFRAVRDINAGEELLSPYITGAAPLGDRERVLAGHFDEGRCDCVLCEADRGDGKVRRERRDILNLEGEGKLGGKREIAHRIGTTGAGKRFVEEIKRHIHSLESTYSSTRPAHLRLDLFGPYHMLAEELRFSYSGSPISLAASIEARFSSFKSVGVVVLDRIASPTLETIDFVNSSFAHFTVLLATNCIAISGVYSAMGKEAKAKAWMSTAIRVGEIFAGGGKAMFREIYGKDVGAFFFSQKVLALTR